MSGSLLSLAHGTNDAQKTMGIIALALIANGDLAAGADPPFWVVVAAATAIALGTYSGGWRIIRTMGSRIIKMDPAQGFTRPGRRRVGDPRRLAPRLPAVDDAHDLRRRHGRGRRAAAVGRPLGRRRQHRARLGPDRARRRPHRRGGVRREPRLRRGRARPGRRVDRVVGVIVAILGRRIQRGPAITAEA